MSVGAGFIPKYRKHSNGQAIVQVRGKKYCLGKYGTKKSKEAYARFLSELIVNPAGATPAREPEDDPEDITVVELIDKYLVYAQQRYPNRVTAENVRRALLVADEFYGTIPAQCFGPRFLRTIQSHLAEKNLSRRYVNEVIGKIRRCFKWGVAEELIPPSVLHGLQAVEGLRRGRSPARETKRIQPVADELVRATLPYLPPAVVAMVRFQRLTGCRPGEVCQLRPMDVDRDGKACATRPNIIRPSTTGTSISGSFSSVPRPRRFCCRGWSATRPPTVSHRKKASGSGTPRSAPAARRPCSRCKTTAARPAASGRRWVRTTARTPTSAPSSGASSGPTRRSSPPRPPPATKTPNFYRAGIRTNSAIRANRNPRALRAGGGAGRIGSFQGRRHPGLRRAEPGPGRQDYEAGRLIAQLAPATHRSKHQIYAVW